MTSTPESRAADRAARRAARAAMTPFDHGQALVKRLSEVTGDEWTFGYIGNVSHWGDDRSWSAFRAHPGRVGTSRDRIGGHSTENIGDLITMLRGALAFAMMQQDR